MIQFFFLDFVAKPSIGNKTSTILVPSTTNFTLITMEILCRIGYTTQVDALYLIPNLLRCSIVFD